MKFCDKEIQDHLKKGGKINRPFFGNPIYFNDLDLVFKYKDNEKVYCLNKEDLTADDWQITDDYYDYLIDNKVLCFFWNEDDEEYDIGYLKSVNKKFSDYPFLGEILTNRIPTFEYYLHCKPVEGKKFNIIS